MHTLELPPSFMGKMIFLWRNSYLQWEGVALKKKKSILKREKQKRDGSLQFPKAASRNKTYTRLLGEAAHRPQTQ